jgi:hypothetical protein
MIHENHKQRPLVFNRTTEQYNMTDIWDEIEESIAVASTCEIKIDNNNNNDNNNKDIAVVVSSAAEEKRQASIAARALERKLLDAEREKRKQQLEEEKKKNKAPTKPIKELTPFEEFIEDFIENRRKELVKKNGKGFIGGLDKRLNPTRGADYERALQDARSAWNNRKL